MSMTRRRRREQAIDAQIAALHARVHPPTPAAVDDLDARVAKVLDQRDRDRQAEQHRRQLASVTVPACRWCGNTRAFTDHAQDAAGRCASCSWHLDRRFTSDDGARDYAAAWLVGIPEQEAPFGVGALVGLRWFHELPRGEQRGTWGRSFAWHTDDEVASWRSMLGLDPPPPVLVGAPVARRCGQMTVTVHTKTPTVTASLTGVDVARVRRARW
jgi:hypothetical protein